MEYRPWNHLRGHPEVGDARFPRLWHHHMGLGGDPRVWDPSHQSIIPLGLKQWVNGPRRWIRHLILRTTFTNVASAKVTFVNVESNRIIYISFSHYKQEEM